MVKITVIRKLFFAELAEAYLLEGQNAGGCPFFAEGDTFAYNGGAVMPEGFCPWAWIDIYRDVTALHANAENDWYLPGRRAVCCTDGVRPVLFSLERLP